MSADFKGGMFASYLGSDIESRGEAGGAIGGFYRRSSTGRLYTHFLMCPARKSHISYYTSAKGPNINVLGIGIHVNGLIKDGKKLQHAKSPSRSVNAGEGRFDVPYINRIISTSENYFPIFPHDNPLVENDELPGKDGKSRQLSIGPGKGSFLFFDCHVEMISRNKVPESSRNGGAYYSTFWNPFEYTHDNW